MSIFGASGMAMPMKNPSMGSPLMQQLLTQIKNQQPQPIQPQPIQPQFFQPQPKAQLGLPLVLQQLYGPEAGAMIQQPVDPAPQGGFTTSPGFRPVVGTPQGGINNIAFAPGFGSSILNPGIRTADFRDSDGDGIDDRDQIGPGQPKFKFADFSLADLGIGSTATLPTLSELAAFNPIANSYALAGFTVGEIAAMPEFADFGASVGSNIGSNIGQGLPGTGSFPVIETGPSKGPEDRGSYDDRNRPTKTEVFGDVVVQISPDGKVTPVEEGTPTHTLAKTVNSFLSNPFSPVGFITGKETYGEALDRIGQDLGQDVANEVAQTVKETYATQTKATDYNPLDGFKTPIQKEYEENVKAAKKAKEEKGGKNGPGAGGGGGKGCFVKGTMIEMADGTEKEITTITVGEQTKGGVVEAKLEFMPTQIYNYKGVEVSGSHLVMENNQFVKVEDSKRSALTDKIEPVYCFETSDNRIWVKGIEFGDYLTGSHDQWQPHIDAMLTTVNKELNGNI